MVPIHCSTCTSQKLLHPPITRQAQSCTSRSDERIHKLWKYPRICWSMATRHKASIFYVMILLAHWCTLAFSGRNDSKWHILLALPIKNTPQSSHPPTCLYQKPESISRCPLPDLTLEKSGYLAAQRCDTSNATCQNACCPVDIHFCQHTIANCTKKGIVLPKYMTQIVRPSNKNLLQSFKQLTKNKSSTMIPTYTCKVMIPLIHLMVRLPLVQSLVILSPSRFPAVPTVATSCFCTSFKLQGLEIFQKRKIHEKWVKRLLAPQK